MTDTDPIPVLIVDNDANDHFFIAQAFKADSSTIHLHKADSSQQASDMLVLIYPAPYVTLLDLNMPGLNGFEMLDHLKRSAQYRHIPVVVLTTSDTPVDKGQAYYLGANGFLTKPTTQQELSVIARQIRLEYDV